MSYSCIMKSQEIIESMVMAVELAFIYSNHNCKQSHYEYQINMLNKLLFTKGNKQKQDAVETY